MSLMKRKKHQAAPKNTFGVAIREIRTAKGWSQEQLAEKVRESADAPWISRVEAGKKDISLRTAIQIAHALGVEMFLDQFRLLSDD